MAFIKLLPFEGIQHLPLEEIVIRLKSEFAYVEVNEEAGRDHVGDMIAATLRFSDEVPWKHEQLVTLQRKQNRAAYIVFGDEAIASAAFCFMPESELFFGNSDEVDGPARALVERAASILNYQLFDG